MTLYITSVISTTQSLNHSVRNLACSGLSNQDFCNVHWSASNRRIAGTENSSVGAGTIESTHVYDAFKDILCCSKRYITWSA